MKKTLIFLTILALLLSACQAAAPQSTKTPPVVRVTMLRVLDALPLFVAEQQGYFAAQGVKVEIIPVSSAPERDQLIASGQADGMINEMTSTLFANRSQTTLQVVRLARAATPTQPVFRLLASAGSNITSVADLKGVQTGISQSTVIEYLFNRLVEAEGYQVADFPTISVPSIADRMALLKSGELKAAMMPDPLASLAIQGGATVVIDDSSHPEYGYSTYAFRKAFIDQNPEALQAFLSALEQAVQAINQTPDQFKDLLTTKELLPSALAASYHIPPFVTAGVPSEAQFADALAWAKSKGLLDKDLAYQDCVNAAFLPK